jgi:hypothetical protein
MDVNGLLIRANRTSGSGNLIQTRAQLIVYRDRYDTEESLDQARQGVDSHIGAVDGRPANVRQDGGGSSQLCLGDLSPPVGLDQLGLGQVDIVEDPVDAAQHMLVRGDEEVAFLHVFVVKLVELVP